LPVWRSRSNSVPCKPEFLPESVPAPQPTHGPTELSILDRYILRNFLEPFLLCFFGFLSIWLVFDLSDNGPDFIEAHASLKQVGLFYLTQLPQTILISLPVGLLLSLLFMLSRMSRFNEVISILGSGRSVLRLLAPLFLMGALASAGCLALNYELAPKAESVKKAAMEQIAKANEKKSRKKGERGSVDGYLFRDRMNLRTWYVRRLRPNLPELTGVHITQQEPGGRITRKWMAARALYEAKGGRWRLQRGVGIEFAENGDIASIDNFTTGERVMSDWSETPWRISSSHLEAQSLSVPELRDYLRVNSDFPDAQLAPFRTYLWHRWALPFSCLVVVLIAAPLGIVYSRRAVLAGVASSIFIFFGMILLTNFCLALGKGARISPVVAACFPNLFFGLVGCVLLYLRSTNRDLPSLKFGRR
jgi:lipopolysaccharide export system permease protein